MILPQSFYNRKTLNVAQDLLGCFLIRKFPHPQPFSRSYCRGRREPNIEIKCKIVETEAYNGPYDLASHASRGKTERNKVMFGPPGIIYVYFTYGMHYMLNIVTERENYPTAVLIRAVEFFPSPLSPLPLCASLERGCMKTNGPAKLTKALHIDKSFNGLPIYTKKYGLWIENRKESIKASQIKKTTRIGVDYAREYKDKKWRFYLRDSKFISKK